MSKFYTFAKINLANLTHNINVIKNLVPESKILSMVKCNAYGHGAPQIADTLNEYVDGFGVASLEEGLELCKEKISKPIVLMKGFRDSIGLKLANQSNFQTVIINEYQMQILEETNLQNPLTVWIKIDTGLHRIGFLPDKIISVYKRLLSNPKIKKPIFFLTHFSDADNIDNPKTGAQLNLFKATINHLEGIPSFANSAAIFSKKLDLKSTWVRVGIAMYGVSPFPNKTAKELNLKPIMTLTSSIIDIKDLKKGDAVGYGSTWICPENMKIGVVNCGYGDGYPRHAKTGTPILVNGRRSQIIGRISMDMLTVDLRNYPDAQICDPVTLWGDNLPVEEIANCADTIAYELFCRLTRRVKFQYVK